MVDLGTVAALRFADRDEVDVLADEIVEEPTLVGPRAVQRVQYGRSAAEERAEHRPDDAGVIVDHVELFVVQVRGERVVRVVPRVSELARVGRLGERRDDLRPAPRPAAREQRDVVAAVDEPGGQE